VEGRGEGREAERGVEGRGEAEAEGQLGEDGANRR